MNACVFVLYKTSKTGTLLQKSGIILIVKLNVHSIVV